METVSEQAAFGGIQGVYRHASGACGCDMTFGLFLPSEARDGPVPLLWYLSGLTCTHENAMLKSGAQAWAAQAGIAVIFPDTSPRGAGVADDAGFDLGQGAGFYLDATEAPWAPHFAMWRYVTEELPDLVFDEFPLAEGAQAITGHSMGGHGALTVALSLPDRFRSVSAFAPIAHPTASDWGRRQFAAYLGEDEARWAAHDASLLLRERGWKGHLLIDQGTEDQFLDKLMPGALMAAVVERRQAATIRLQRGYDHSYFFVASFMADHVAFHAEALFA
ncbi:MAG TPA: S-formylglutathione hydrolase [Amaricoccus sp.]|uniref:S-formylglutathione hydrolase n=1 Tax=Amaricoccus sp. TaxID=1872485 RepID=UPI001D666591|nr:S-formylglutathione hydrolase [Amaricoccus sp.]MCB1403147.1 S-formylglutathione hydrolase [Paracoccaceae bacterium]MCC0067555.1 S-formylglutathione hydrolase [Rhodovulum sp.]HPG22001.1 S-formylglutathione hydrolase [Amaricoccus sp.]HRW16732.1 S-formylglutathione hydrolase [Amaricoccus sp.]